jgi:hypothetical protein
MYKLLLLILQNLFIIDYFIYFIIIIFYLVNKIILFLFIFIILVNIYRIYSKN